MTGRVTDQNGGVLPGVTVTVRDLGTRVGRAASASEVGDAIRHDVERFTDGVEPSDDMAILVVRWKGPASATGR